MGTFVTKHDLAVLHVRLVPNARPKLGLAVRLNPNARPKLGLAVWLTVNNYNVCCKTEQTIEYKVIQSEILNVEFSYLNSMPTKLSTSFFIV